MKVWILSLLCLLSVLVPIYAADGYEWRKTDSGDYGLLKDGKQVGAYMVAQQTYYMLTEREEWIVVACPTALPAGICTCDDHCTCGPGDCKCGKPAPEPIDRPVHDWTADGVDVDRIEAGRHSVNGQDCTKREVIAAIKASVPADADKLRLCVIGETKTTEAVLSDLKGLPAANSLLVTSYTPDHWAVAKTGLAAGNLFSIVLLSPDGTVLHRQNDYNGGAISLSEALRDAQADYDAARDPDKRNTNVFANLLKTLKDVPEGVWIGLGFLILFLVIKKKG